MNLKSLELNGFKSFGKKTELEFSSPIVAIVGPNGSGKSNVAEGFRFALGEQSMKSMRGKRGEDLIFSGGKTLGKLNRAGVKLTFDNRNKLFNLDFEEVSLERVVYRDGTNEYLINGSVVRLRDVMELLSEANIGASGHHIISQGEADRMLNASIKERKGMIEDALGLKIYQYKKQKSERKLEKTHENIGQVNSLRKEIAPHIKFLEKQLEKVEKADSLREELIGLSQEYLKREEVYLHKEREKIASERKGPSDELEKLEKRVKEIKEALEGEKMDQQSKKLLAVEGKIEEVNEEEEKWRSEVSRLEGSLMAEERALIRAKGRSGEISAISVPLQELKNLKSEIEAVSSGAEGADLNGLRGLIRKITTIFQEFIGRKEQEGSSQNTLEDIEKEISSLREKKEECQRRFDEARAKSSALKEEYRALREIIEKENKEGREAEREMFTLLNRRSELLSILQGLKNQIEILEREELSFKEELKEAQALIGIEAIRYSNLSISGNEDRVEQEKRRKHLEKLKIRLEEIGGGGGDDVRKEYKEVTERDQFLSKEIADLEVSEKTLRDLIAELEEKLQSEFKIGIDKINTEFQKYFALMFGGGHASLFVLKALKRKHRVEDLLDEEMTEIPEEEEEEEGIDINVSLPNKRIKGLTMLSGGERALTSIALLFAISQVNPPPFVILDETDAALDEANSKKYGDMVENLAKHSQLILITHNRETMSRAGILYGVTMGGEGYSKLLSVKFEEAVAVAK